MKIGDIDAQKIIGKRPNETWRVVGFLFSLLGAVGVAGVSFAGVVASPAVNFAPYILIVIGGLYLLKATKLVEQYERETQAHERSVAACSSRRRDVQIPTHSDKELIDFIRENPGCHARDIEEHYRASTPRATKSEIWIHMGMLRRRLVVMAGWVKDVGDVHTVREDEGPQDQTIHQVPRE